MRIVSSLNSQIMRTMCPICKGYHILYPLQTCQLILNVHSVFSEQSKNALYVASLYGYMNLMIILHVPVVLLHTVHEVPF